MPEVTAFVKIAGLRRRFHGKAISGEGLLLLLKGAKELLLRRPELLLELHGREITKYGFTAPDVLGLLNPSYTGTFVSWPERGRVHSFPEEKFGVDDFVNFFLA